MAPVVLAENNWEQKEPAGPQVVGNIPALYHLHHFGEWKDY